jgi:hypothetical protein
VIRSWDEDPRSSVLATASSDSSPTKREPGPVDVARCSRLQELAKDGLSCLLIRIEPLAARSA